MLRNYLTMTLRNARRHKGYAGLNVAGLAVGLACCLLILLYVRDELSFDRFHANADRIYRIEMDVAGPDEVVRWSQTLVPVGDVLRERLPEIEHVTRVSALEQPLVARGTTRFYEERFFYAEPSFFEVFDFELLTGNAAELGRPGTVVLTESVAARYFPGENPVGQTLAVTDRWEREPDVMEVVGIMADPPHNAHFRPAFLGSLATSIARNQDRLWQRIAHTYVLLREGRTAEALAARLSDLDRDVLHAHFSERARFALMPLVRIHLYGTAESDIAPQGDIRYVYIFSAIAALILLIACINYTNLATARSARRAREVGVRKVVGARRSQLVAQFMAESLLFSGIALVLAVGLVQLLLPAFGRMMDHPLRLDLSSLDLLLWLGAAVLVVGVAAGSYPALLLASFRPVRVLKGAAPPSARPLLRKGLVVFQFAVSVALIICTIVIQQQLHYVQHTRLGFDEEQVLVIRTRDRLGNEAAAFRQQLARLGSVQQVALASGIPGDPTAISWFAPDDIEGFAGSEGSPPVFDHFWIDDAFVPALRIGLAAGRNFSEAFPTDAKEAILVNETAARRLGWTEPLGKTIRLQTGQKRVVGVVRDFHVKDMKQEIGPMLFEYRPAAATYAVVKLGTADLQGAIGALAQTWQQFVPEHPFEYSFLDDDFEAMYRAEQRLGRLFGVFAGLAVFIACLGLFGLAAYTAERRTKEIGVRKVLGASVSSLVGLLSTEFVRLVLAGFAVATPLAYVAMSRWLEAFAYRVEISWRIFLLAGLGALLVALATVSYQAIRAALSDPVKALRYE